MIPTINENEGLTPDFEEVIGPSKNYRLLTDKERIIGFVDDIEAIKQAIYLILSTERYDHVIYSFNGGVEFKDLIGKPVSYVATEAKKRIAEALLQDDRITAVDSFDVKINKNNLHVTYVAHTIFGEIESEKEVLF